MTFRYIFYLIKLISKGLFVVHIGIRLESRAFNVAHLEEREKVKFGDLFFLNVMIGTFWFHTP